MSNPALAWWDHVWMEDLLPWFLGQLDEHERNVRAREHPDHGEQERKLLSSILDMIKSDRQVAHALGVALSILAEHPHDEAAAKVVATRAWSVKDRAKKYAEKPGYLEQWRPTPTG